MRQRRLQFVLFATASIVVAVFFQNCGKAGFSTNGSNSITLDTSTTDEVPFAYDTTFDQISYNSCFGPQTAGKKPYFTLMAGAYSGGGVWLRQDFLDYTKSGAIKPEYPATTVSDLQIKNTLYDSSNNVEAAPQMAIRTNGSPQEVRTPAAAAPVEGVDFITMLGDLTDDRWMHPLVTNKVRNIYFNLAPSLQRRMEGAITYNKDEGTAQGLRDDLGTHGVLALTFKIKSDKGLPSMARPIAVATDATIDYNKVYGRGYAVTFERVIAPYTTLYDSSAVVPNFLNPMNIMTSIQELDLSGSGRAVGSWTCSESRRYLVVKQTDQKSYCPPDPYSYMTDGISGVMTAEQYRQEFEIARRHLKAESWDISVQFRCAVPREGSCYVADAPVNGQEIGIEYDQRQTCFQALEGIGYTTVPVKRCAQYVSICNRD